MKKSLIISSIIIVLLLVTVGLFFNAIKAAYYEHEINSYWDKFPEERKNICNIHSRLNTNMYNEVYLFCTWATISPVDKNTDLVDGNQQSSGGSENKFSFEVPHFKNKILPYGYSLTNNGTMLKVEETKFYGNDVMKKFHEALLKKSDKDIVLNMNIDIKTLSFLHLVDHQLLFSFLFK